MPAYGRQDGQTRKAAARALQCAGSKMQLPGQEADAEEAVDRQVQKPFAQLGELLKRK
jgi:hypothetical protein